MTVRFKVFMSVSVQILVLWVVTLYLHRGTAFGGTFCPHLQGTMCGVRMLHW
jgi:hypothetical protein